MTIVDKLDQGFMLVHIRRVTSVVGVQQTPAAPNPPKQQEEAGMHNGWPKQAVKILTCKSLIN